MESQPAHTPQQAAAPGAVQIGRFAVSAAAADEHHSVSPTDSVKETSVRLGRFHLSDVAPSTPIGGAAASDAPPLRVVTAVDAPPQPLEGDARSALSRSVSDVSVDMSTELAARATRRTSSTGSIGSVSASNAGALARQSSVGSGVATTPVSSKKAGVRHRTSATKRKVGRFTGKLWMRAAQVGTRLPEI